jgi:hypothetical protein|tara:strand:+ start:81 stop:239 length:159 start_codon:yes stop_codon:yes gene_type:complete
MTTTGDEILNVASEMLTDLNDQFGEDNKSKRRVLDVVYTLIDIDGTEDDLPS